jgi:pyruvate formate lyase activating enzyme
MEEAELLAFLKKRQGILEGVCITGGEPTLYAGLENLLRSIKALGYHVKLDTNGSKPAVLRHLVEEGLVDYVAMDVKNSPEKYAETTGVPGLKLASVEESLRYLMEENVAYELRTTLVQQLHDAASIEEMGRWLAALVPGKLPRVLYLQTFVDRDTVAFAGLSAPEEGDVRRFSRILEPYVRQVRIRGE